MASTDVNGTTRAMKKLLFATVLVFAAMPAFSQPAQNSVVVGTEDLTRLIARAQATQDGANPARPQVIVPIISADSYVFNLERHIGKGPGSLHPIWAELIVVMQGTGTIATGGSVVDPVTSADGNVHGSDISGGAPEHVVPGDLMIVPQGVAHILVGDAGVPLVVATLHLPRSAAASGGKTETPKLVHHAADLAAMLAQARKTPPAQSRSNSTLLSLPPYRIELKDVSVKEAAVLHKNEGAFLYVLEGEGDLITDGSLVHPRDRGADVDGDDIQGGNARRLKKGDFVYVPRNVPFVARTESNLVLATLKVPNLSP
jgi:mannose-6-phosphate isomerase-like protein (cupin superfamily)